MTSPAVTGRTQDTAGQATRVMDHRGLKLLLMANGPASSPGSSAGPTRWPSSPDG